MKLSALVPPPGKSKYELSIVASREARRLNDWIRRSGETLHGKVTAVALERVLHDDVPYYYEDPQALLVQPTDNMGDGMGDSLGDPLGGPLGDPLGGALGGSLADPLADPTLE